jgi:protein-disulfide isomerase
LAAGVVIGPNNAKLRIVEFMDFQCPFCRSWSARLDSLMIEFPNEVQVSLHHMPIARIHPHAVAAAIASECADRQGRFPAFKRTLFVGQDEIGKEPWQEFARRANVPDIGAFTSCIALGTDSFPRIAYGQELAAKTNVSGTPTVWINGVVRRPTLVELRKLVQ